jgi:hypothetical protein
MPEAVTENKRSKRDAVTSGEMMRNTQRHARDETTGTTTIKGRRRRVKGNEREK